MTNGTFLLVEDDEALGQATQDVLLHLGHTVEWVTTVAAAYGQLAGSGLEYDGVLLDLGLGAEDGVGLVSRLREQGFEPPPIIIFSAQPSAVLTAAAKHVKALAILQKPYNVASLRAVLQRALAA